MSRTNISYYKTFKTRCKGRWINQELLLVLQKEFSSKTEHYFKNAIESGAILINNQKTNVNYKLKEKDILYHIIHIHEPLPIKINVIYEHEEYLIVNKPPGIACHPTSNYNHFSITKILEPKYGHLSCINRLDVPTSGIVILARKNLEKYHHNMLNKEIKKFYIAKVKGDFKNQTVNKRIKRIPGKFNVIDDSGKDCITEFSKIHFDGEFSLVECRPITGRSHQIRVHLQSLGFPIENDILYNDLCNNLTSDRNFICDGRDDIISEIDDIFENKSDDDLKSFLIKNCEGENNKPFKNLDNFICLHAYKYIFDGKEFVAPLPDWANF